MSGVKSLPMIKNLLCSPPATKEDNIIGINITPNLVGIRQHLEGCVVVDSINERFHNKHFLRKLR